ncbi:MAG: hypothetical protein ACYTFY_23280 [Planctomycetota bacterium]|jgi:hypothetical protein
MISKYLLVGVMLTAVLTPGCGCLPEDDPKEMSKYACQVFLEEIIRQNVPKSIDSYSDEFFTKRQMTREQYRVDLNNKVNRMGRRILKYELKSQEEKTKNGQKYWVLTYDMWHDKYMSMHMFACVRDFKL